MLCFLNHQRTHEKAWDKMSLALNVPLLPQRFPKFDVPPIPCFSCAVDEG